MRLPPETHCSDDFSRYDKETVFAANSKEYSCDF